jgi:anti-sigma-K factor RskA
MDPFDKLRTGCQEVMDLLDAYALGAVDKADAIGLDRHVADCVRCWEELNKAQRTAALLALSIPLAEAPRQLGERIMVAAQRKGRAAPFGSGFFQRLRLISPVTAGASAMAGVVALIFAGFLQMGDLQDENNSLERQVEAADTELAQQQQVLAVLSASDTQKLPMGAISTRRGPTGVYTWSAVEGTGFLSLRDLPSQPDQQVYQLWFTFDKQALPVGTCVPLNGSCDFAVQFGLTRRQPDGVGVSVEPAGGSLAPTSKWLLFASFDNEQ